VRTERRPTADTALLVGEDEPLLALWRYGLGTVAAWTSDDGGRWASDWARKDEAGKLLTQLVRFVMRRQGGGQVDARLALHDETAVLTVDVPEDAEYGRLSAELLAVDASGAQKPISSRLERQAPGRWIARGHGVVEPFSLARIFDAKGQLLSEVTAGQDGAGELAAVGPDSRVLEELARAGGGQLHETATAAMRRNGPAGTRPVALWPWLALLAALLTCVDLWLRRAGGGNRRRLSEMASIAVSRPDLADESTSGARRPSAHAEPTAAQPELHCEPPCHAPPGAAEPGHAPATAPARQSS
jgi:hypothetical protein